MPGEGWAAIGASAAPGPGEQGGGPQDPSAPGMPSASVKYPAVPVTSKKPADDLVEQAGDDELALLPVMGTLGGEQDMQHRGVGEVGERQIDDGTWSAGLLRQRAGLFQQRGAVVIEGPADADDKGLVLDSMGHHSRCMNVHGRQHAMPFGHRF